MEPSSLSRQECVVYHSVGDPYLFLFRSLQPTSDPFSIAQQYGCELEFRPACWKQPYDTNYLSPAGVQEDGYCTAAVLVGGDREKLALARDDIKRTLGSRLINGGWVEVGKRVE